jgi:hypothetical protein
MATVAIQDGGETRSIKIDGVEVSQYVTEYNADAKTDTTPMILMEVDAGTEIVFENAEVKWKFNFPSEVKIRQAMYQTLKNEFEVSG